MEFYALVKKNGVTSKILGSDVELVIEPIVRKSMISIIDSLIDKFGNEYIFRVEDIDSAMNSNIMCKNIAICFLKKISGYSKYNFNTNKVNILDLKEKVINYPINIVVNSDNFDFILKELGIIKVSDNKSFNSNIHNCGDCVNLSPLMCEKAQYLKKKISCYDFITDGFQIVRVQDDKEYLDVFIVLKCNNLNLENKEKVRVKNYFSK